MIFLFEIQKFPLKMYLKMSPTKRRPSCIGLDVLIQRPCAINWCPHFHTSYSHRAMMMGYQDSSSSNGRQVKFLIKQQIARADDPLHT